MLTMLLGAVARRELNLSSGRIPWRVAEHRAGARSEGAEGLDWFGPVRIVLTFALVTIGWSSSGPRRLGKVSTSGQMFAPPSRRCLWPRWQFWAAAIVLVLAVWRAPAVV